MTTDDQVVLSAREKEALRLLLVGHDAKSIANTLGLSVHTINDRLRDARRKLGVSSSREAARRLAEMDGGTPIMSAPKKLGVPKQLLRWIEPKSQYRRDRRGIAWRGLPEECLSCLLSLRPQRF